MRRRKLPRLATGLRAIAIGAALAALLAGCYVAPAPPGPSARWCYYHPYRC